MFKKKEPHSAKILPDDDLKKLASFFQLLISVDRRISKLSKEKTSRRSAKSSQRKNEVLGSQIKRAFIILYKQLMIWSKTLYDSPLFVIVSRHLMKYQQYVIL